MSKSTERVIWYVKGIAEYIDRPYRSVQRMLEQKGPLFRIVKRCPETGHCYALRKDLDRYLKNPGPAQAITRTRRKRKAKA